MPGAFAAPLSRRFHERFIADRFAAGNVQLVRLTAGDQEVGYLYNMVANGAVFAYQSGFAYSENPHLKPGLVTHAACIEANLRGGLRLYDLLAGRSQYKESLSLDVQEMAWVRLQRPRVKLSLERQLRAAWRALRRARANATTGKVAKEESTV
jgi:CelD/BcsL family acetyltransferase involved in cellulose biosynthesis